MKVGVDIDGVLRNFAESLVRQYKIYNPKSRVTPVNQWTKYELEDYFSGGNPVKDFFIRTHPEKVYLEANPYKGAKQFIDRLNEKGHKVHLVSYQPTSEIKHLTRIWLAKNQIQNVYLNFTEDRQKFNLGLDVLLDDYTENLNDVKYRTRGALPIAMDRPWNQDWGFLRVSQYSEFIVLLDSIKHIRDGWVDRGGKY
jgi:hypothetical protein